MAVLLNAGVANMDPDVQASLKALKERHRMVSTTLCSCGTTVPEEDERCARYLQELDVHEFIAEKIL